MDSNGVESTDKGVERGIRKKMTRKRAADGDGKILVSIGVLVLTYRGG